MSLRGFRWLLLLLSLPLIVLAIAILLHPWLSITRPSGAEVVVVEGWIPADVMPQVKEEIDRRGYTRIYTTGTIRPFAYWLRKGEKIAVELHDPLSGGIEMKAAGLPDAQITIIAGVDTMRIDGIAGELRSFWMDLPAEVDNITIEAEHNGWADDADVIFLQQLQIRGIPAHQLAAAITIERIDGSTHEGWPTHAHYAKKLLTDLGIDEGKITAVPVMDEKEGRTKSNAKAFANTIDLETIGPVDVISIGVHARRSRNEFQKACGEGIEVGVIAIEDPEAPVETWWRTKAGWLKLLKEIAGLTR